MKKCPKCRCTMSQGMKYSNGDILWVCTEPLCRFIDVERFKEGGKEDEPRTP